MTVSVLLRLACEALAEGRLAGHAELVATGESVLFSDADAVVALARRQAATGGQNR